MSDDCISREEAIRQFESELKWAELNTYPYVSKQKIEADKMAIKALEQEPCGKDINVPATDAISREDALQALCRAVHKNDDTIPCPNQRVSCLWNKTKVQDYAEEILKLPSVTPQQKTGHWIKTIGENGVTSAVCCSECGFEDNRYTLFKYCPNCGTKMFGG